MGFDDGNAEGNIMGNSVKGCKVAISGAGRGLGAALAIVLADEGADPILTGRDITALSTVAAAIEARTGRLPSTVRLDLADTASVEQAAAAITELAPALDMLINNGAMWLEGRDTPFTAAEVNAVVSSAVTGTFLLTQALMPALEKSARPDVVTIGSISGLQNTGCLNAAVPFFAAKHGQRGVIDGLRQRFIGTKIRSIGLHPPGIEDISPLDPAWAESPHRGKDAGVTNRDIVEAVLFAVTRPRHVTVASLVIDADRDGMFS